MPRKKPSPAQNEAYSYDLVAKEVEDQLKGFPQDRDLSDAETTAHFRKNRKYIIAQLIATMKYDPDPEERKAARNELLAQDIGKAGTRKKSDSDDIGVVIMAPGEYGISKATLEEAA